MTATSLLERLQRGGVRLTPQRLAIARYLDGNRRHPSAADIHRALQGEHPNLSLATVYNTLRLFSELGAVLEVRLDDGHRYDPDTTPHVNVVCDRCGAIVDVPGEATPLAALAATVEHASGYRLAAAQTIVVRGRCPGCTAESF
jgi:Fur family peroxide stress response transcriptional regulator